MKYDVSLSWPEPGAWVHEPSLNPSVSTLTSLELHLSKHSNWVGMAALTWQGKVPDSLTNTLFLQQQLI